MSDFEQDLNQVSENGIPLIEDMANAIQKYTGLPGVIYFCTKQEMTNPQAHALGRVKWIHAGKEAFISIKKGKDGKRIAGGERKMIPDLECFISKNEEILWNYWNTPMDQADSAEVLISLTKI
jgi:hypothetical protein